MTAAEFQKELDNDPVFQAEAAARQRKFAALANELRVAEQPLVEELHKAGLMVDSAWDLVNTSADYQDALPILIRHLEEGDYPDRVREGIARAMAVRAAAVYWPRLETLYRNATLPDAASGLALALAASATPQRVEQLIDLLHDEKLGDSRIFLLKSILRHGGAEGLSAVSSVREHPLFTVQARRLLRSRTRS